MNTSIYLGLAISALRKIKMCEYWYDYIKPKYGENIRLCYMDTDSFIMHIKTDVFIKILLKMLKKSMIHQIIPLKDQWVKIRKKLVY